MPSSKEVEEIEKRVERLWKDLQEQRTIIGRGTEKNPDPCELTLRAEHNLAVRYAYQSTHEHFYEEKIIIDEILIKHQVDPNGTKIPSGYEFNLEIARGSYLNSLTYKTMNSRLYDEPLQTNEEQKINKNQQKRMEEIKRKLEERKKR